MSLIIGLLLVFPFFIYFILNIVVANKRLIQVICGLYYYVSMFLILKYNNSIKVTLIILGVITIINLLFAIIRIVIIKKKNSKIDKQKVEKRGQKKKKVKPNFLREFLRGNFMFFPIYYIGIIILGLVNTWKGI